MKINIKSISYSRITLYLVLFYIFLVIMKDQRWKRDDIISQDTNFYYIYLPAAFIYHDLTFNYITDSKVKLPEEARKRSWTLLTSDWRHVSKMPCGYAIMHLPFFLIAHNYLLLKGRQADGYSDITYSKFIFMSAFFYLMIALIYQRKILLHFFNEAAASLTLIILAFATNVYYYTVYIPGMAHIFGFCLFTLLVWQTIKWHQLPTTTNSIAMGLLLGLIVLVRASNIVIALFPLLYAVHNKESLLKKLSMIKKLTFQILLILIFFFLAIMPQLILWKLQTGHFLYYSYQQERFYFDHPHIFQGLFGFRKGLFIYTPIMILAIFGFIIAFRNKQQYGLASIVFFIVNCFVVFSWWCWWYGGSFGMRAMIESFAVLALPLTAFSNFLLKKNIFFKSAFVLLIIGFLILNQFQSIQANSSLLHYDSMTFNTYKKIFGTLAFPPGYDNSLCTPDYDYARLGKPERNYSLDSYSFITNGHEANVIIKASNGKYVSADRDLDGGLVANRSNAWAWEHFHLTVLENGKCCLTSWQNKFVTADLDHNASIIANRSYAGEWEKFVLISEGDNKYALRAVNNKYLRYNDNNKFKLEANSDSITNKDVFEIVSD